LRGVLALADEFADGQNGFGEAQSGLSDAGLPPHMATASGDCRDFSDLTAGGCGTGLGSFCQFNRGKRFPPVRLIDEINF